ncbi:DUF3179 domain-containing (seleno)protein [Phaeodactylibacter luteus]|uniref:DUF3179 domain-containing protein n=1 Tax=Phaeodactylibacter luteus TaxID=1564516 RepID=A0A5C6RMR1_9BACT|nr:DUF3179 domain-containing (seleno)protein [Phaeodactylibacter luteus]TXB63503.1 DUF3179 domain-containing protein [Phaeodactylibacter luteus]
MIIWFAPNQKEMTMAARLIFVSTLYVLCLASCTTEREPTVAAGGSGESRQVTVLNLMADGQPIVAAGSNGRDFAVAFAAVLQEDTLVFDAVQGAFPVVMRDEKGNEWDVFGKAVSGPDAGAALEPVVSGRGFWFVFGALYPGVEIWGQGMEAIALATDTVPGWAVAAQGLAQGMELDEIPSLDNPEFVTYQVLGNAPEAIFYLQESDRVVAVKVNGEVKLYPIPVLNWHEVINDEVGGVPVAIMYAPLTGTTRVYERPDGVEFGVSGIIYNNNLLAFDRLTESFWLQWEGRCVFGSRVGEQLSPVPYVVVSFSTWLQVDSQPQIVSGVQENGFPYGDYPFGDYPENQNITYPLMYLDTRLPAKEEVFMAGQSREGLILPKSAW